MVPGMVPTLGMVCTIGGCAWIMDVDSGGIWGLGRIWGFGGFIDRGWRSTFSSAIKCQSN